jgi:hypothetical protein
MGQGKDILWQFSRRRKKAIMDADNRDGNSSYHLRNKKKNSQKGAGNGQR